MTNGNGGPLLRQLRRMIGAARAETWTDAALLRRFTRSKDESAFAELVRRHGPMVLGVCRRRLGHAQDAEDAFQATFLVLARKAGSIRRRASVSGWLYRVACRLAADAREAAARRRAAEQSRPDQPPGPAAADEAERRELTPLLDEELLRLPEKYRRAVVLCCLEGKSLAAAAADLGWPLGTVAGRLSRARDLLRVRLSRRGLAPSAAISAAALAEGTALAAVPAELAKAAVQSALIFRTGAAAAGVSAPAAALAKGALRTMTVNKWKTAAVLAVVVGTAVAGGVALWGRPPVEAPPVPEKPAPAADRPADDGDKAADRRALVKGNNEFAVDLYGRLRIRSGNLFFSPYSISSALAMAYAGAGGDTAEQMAKVLHFDLPPGRLHPAFAALRQDVAGDDKKRGYELQVAAGLWRAKHFALRAEFKDLIKDNYGADVVGEVDSFDGEARKAVNGWVDERTHGKIKELLGPRDLREDALWVLADAVYFRGGWALTFPKELTYDGDFRVSADEKVKTPLMHFSGDTFKFRFKGDDTLEKAGLEDGFNYLDAETFQALELPYVGKRASMVIFLPKKIDGLEAFEKEWTADKLDRWLAQMKPQPVDVFLPRFQFSSEARLDQTLSEMGMDRAFRADKADFSRMGSDRSWIDAAVHKAVVEVNEKGTEGSAATALVGVGGKVEMAEFKADHPFAFLIRDNRSGAVLFLGRVVNPKE
jgi:serpin B